MLKLFSPKYIHVTLFLLAIFTHCTQAQNIAKSVKSSFEPSSENGGHLQIGLEGGYSTAILEEGNQRFVVLNLSGRYQWYRAFIEIDNTGFAYNGPSVGYTFWQGQHTSLDIMANISDGFDPDDYDRLENAGLRARSPKINLGFRLTAQIDDYLVQGHVFNSLVKDSDAPGDKRRVNGVSASLAIGKQWQLRNWNFYGLAGLNYQSGELNNYYFGIDDFEASPAFGAYSASSGISAATRWGVTYPIGRDWVFDSAVDYRRASSAVADSPLLDDTYSASIGISISYVF